MIRASLNRCKGIEDQVGDFLKQLAAKLELVLFALEMCEHSYKTRDETETKFCTHLKTTNSEQKLLDTFLMKASFF